MKQLLCAFLIVLCSEWAPIRADAYPEKFEGIGREFGGHPLDLISAFLPNNPVIFEAGGHYGEDTLNFSTKWPEGKVISFEPNPAAFEKLLQVSSKKNNIFPYQLAVAHFNGPGVFYVCYGTTGDDPIFEGASSLLPASEEMKIHYGGPVVSVDCVILDDWCKENSVDKIDFIWLDLEGMELHTLASSPEILKTVKVIYTETNFRKFRVGTTQYAELKSFLERSGFQLLSHWYREGLQGNAIFISRKEGMTKLFQLFREEQK